MTWTYWLGAAAAFGLLIYLIAAMIRAEDL